jgi:hypothetical protein
MDLSPGTRTVPESGPLIANALGEGEVCAISPASLTAALSYGKASADSAGVYIGSKQFCLIERLKAHGEA